MTIHETSIQRYSTVNAWRAIGLSMRTLVCADCDVSWSAHDRDSCWMCGQAGARLADLAAWPAAPSPASI